MAETTSTSGKAGDGTRGYGGFLYAPCSCCNGTGAEKPDCYLCKGYRSIRVSKALRHGYRKSELLEEEDGYSECPVCNGYSCPRCLGECKVRLDCEAQELGRVLRFGLTQQIPPLIYRDWRGRVRQDHDTMLSRKSADEARAKGYISWLCSAFGDEIYLTDSGKEVARIASVRAILREGTLRALSTPTGDAKP